MSVRTCARAPDSSFSWHSVANEIIPSIFCNRNTSTELYCTPPVTWIHDLVVSREVHACAPWKATASYCKLLCGLQLPSRYYDVINCWHRVPFWYQNWVTVWAQHLKKRTQHVPCLGRYTVCHSNNVRWHSIFFLHFTCVFLYSPNDTTIAKKYCGAKILVIFCFWQQFPAYYQLCFNRKLNSIVKNLYCKATYLLGVQHLMTGISVWLHQGLVSLANHTALFFSVPMQLSAINVYCILLLSRTLNMQQQPMQIFSICQT